MPRVEEILVWGGLKVQRGGQPPGDAVIVTTCGSCGAEQALAEAEFSEGADESVYTCKNGCQPIAIVGPCAKPWPGRGYRLGKFMLRNPADVVLWPRDTKGNVLSPAILIPASPAALADESAAP